MAKAHSKAQAVAQAHSWSRPTVIIGADTLVAFEGKILGKPLDRIDAKRILTELSGTKHQVITGLCLQPSAMDKAFVTVVDSTWVEMKEMPEEAIEAYVTSGEADGKAGAYAIQENGDRFVKRIEGSFHTVVGFPLELFEDSLMGHLEAWGWAT